MQFFQSLRGHILGLTFGIFLFVTAASADEWTVYTSANSGFPGSLARQSAIDSDGAVWIATDAGLARLQAGQWRVWNTENSTIPGDDVRDLDVAGNTVWVATNRGLFALDRSNDTERVWTTENSDLPANFIRSLAAEDDLAVWLATSNGLAFFVTSGFIVYNTANSDLPTNNVQTVELSTGEGVWCGTEGGGVARFNGNSWTVFNESNSGLPSNIVFAIRPVGPNEAYFGAWGAGLAHVKSGTWQVFNSQNSGLAHNWINAIALNSCESLLLGTRAAGLSMRSGDSWETIGPSTDGLPDGQVFSVNLDPERNVWLGYNGGIAVLDLAESVVVGRPERLEYCAGAQFELPLGTRGEFDPQNSFFVQLSDADGDFSSALALTNFSGSCASAVTVQLPERLPTSSAYRLRVVSSLPTSISEMDQNITINTEPQFNISGPDFLCPGETVSLSVEPGFTSYEWSTGESSPSIEVNSPGNYSVLVTDGNTCSASKSFAVRAADPILLEMPNDTVFCRGELLELQALSSGGQIAWTPAEFVDDPNSAIVTVNIQESATLTVRLTSAQGCAIVDSVIVEVVEPPTKPTIEVRGDTLIGTFEDVEFAFWIREDELLGNALADPRFVPTEPGTYYLRVANDRGCGISSDSVTWPQIVSVDLNELVPSMTIGPNPFVNSLNLERRSGSHADLHLGLEVVLFDILGRAVLQAEWPAGSEVLRLETGGLSAGAYVLVVSGAEGRRASRVVWRR